MMCSFEFYSLIFLQIHVIRNGYVHRINEKKKYITKKKKAKLLSPITVQLSDKTIIRKSDSQQKKVGSVFSNIFFTLS